MASRPYNRQAAQQSATTQQGEHDLDSRDRAPRKRQRQDAVRERLRMERARKPYLDIYDYIELEGF